MQKLNTTRLFGYFLYVVLTINTMSALAVSLTGDTSAPRHSLFLPGQPIVLHFTVNGVPSENDEHLVVEIEDEQEQQLAKYEIPLRQQNTADWSANFIDGATTAEQRWQIDISPRHDRLGFFKAKARLASGELLAGSSSRPPGFLTYAIILDPAQRQIFPPRETFFGMMGANEPGLLGQSWWVHNYNMYCWIAFEPDNPSQFDQKVKDYEAEEARGGWATMPHFVGKHHFSIGGKHGHIPAYSLLPIGKPPYWAARNETRTHNNAALTKEGEAAFHDFCQKIGRYMAANRADQEVHYYQITTEPQIPWGYKGSNEELVRLFEIAHAALHEVDPNAMVAGPGLGLEADWQLEELLSLGMAEHLDVLDFHPYMGGDVLPSEFKLVQKIRDVKELVRKYTDRQLPMTGTEAGYNATGENQEKWLRMAWSDVQHNLILLGEGFWFNVCFHGADNSREQNQNTWGHFFNLDPQRDYGIQKASPKPVVPAYATMSWLLEGHQSAGAIEWLGNGVNAYAYQRDQSIILAMWSDWPQEVTIPVAKPAVQHYDWMGNSKQLDCPDGVLKLPLTQSPQYIIGLEREQWASDGSQRPLRVLEARLRAVPGNKINVNCQVLGIGDNAFHGELQARPAASLGLEPTSRAITCQPGEKITIDFSWQLPDNAAFGEQQLAFVLLADNIPRAGAGTTVLVEPRLQIGRMIPTINNEQIGVAIDLQAAETAAFAGQIIGQPQNHDLPTRQAPITLDAGKHSRMQFFWLRSTPPPWQLAVTATATDNNGKEIAKRNVDFNICAATRMAKPPAIDGDLQDWHELEALLLGQQNLATGAEHWCEDSDFSATVKFAWDEQALYIACAVRDEQHYQHAIKMPYYSWDDSLEVAINLDPQNAHLAGGTQVEGGILKRWHEFIFAKPSTDPDKPLATIRTSSYDLRFAPAGNLDAEQMTAAISRSEGLTTYELALPWKMLGLEKKPEPGTALGITLLLHDLDLIDGERKAKTIKLFDGLAPKRDLSKYGWLKLRP